MSRPLRVLHVTPSYHPAVGGIEEFVRALCAYSLKTGHVAPEICVCNDGYPGVPASEVKDGTPIWRVRCRGRGPLRWVPDVSALKRRYDLVHIHDPHVGALTARFALSGPHRPLVLSTHGGFFHTTRLRAVKRAYFATVVPALLSRVHAVVASSAHDAQTFSAVTRRLVCVDNGIDFDRFHAARAPQLPPEDDCIYIGRVAANKRVNRLIEAFARLKSLRQAVPTLHVVGDDSEGLAPALQSLAARHGIGAEVVFHGRLSDRELPRLISRCRFVVSASAYEGFGLSIVEAMAAGLVPLVNPIPTFRAFVDDGVNGKLVDFADAARAAAQIAGVLALPPSALAQMRDGATATARRYSWSDRVYRFLDLYRRLVEGDPDRALPIASDPLSRLG